MPVSATHAVVAQLTLRPDARELLLARLDAFGEVVGDLGSGVAELRQQAVDVGADVLHLAHVGRPGDVALAVGDVDALEEADVALGVVAHVHGHPGTIGAVLVVLAEQHHLDVVLPGAPSF